MKKIVIYIITMMIFCLQIFSEGLVYKNGVLIDSSNNKPHTGYIENYEGKILIEKIPFKYGLVHGISFFYYNTGEKSMTMTSVNGIAHGKSEQFYKSGKLKGTLNYVNGKINGVVISYYENGNIMQKFAYKEGLKYGAYELYNEKGKLIEKGNYNQGKRNGEVYSYNNISGKLDFIYTYENDLMVNKKSINK